MAILLPKKTAHRKVRIGKNNGIAIFSKNFLHKIPPLRVFTLYYNIDYTIYIRFFVGERAFYEAFYCFANSRNVLHGVACTIC